MYRDIYYGMNKLKKLSQRKGISFCSSKKDKFNHIITLNLNHYLKTGKQLIEVNFIESKIPRVIMYKNKFDFYCTEKIFELVFDEVVVNV